MKGLHTNWRDTTAWRAEGLKLSTTNNEAAKLYDATLSQYIGWYDEPSVGGIENSCIKMLETDPEFVMGHIIVNGLDLMGTGRSPKLDPSFQEALDTISKLAGKAQLTDRENMHVEAMDMCGKGYMSEACDIWEKILVLYPTDLLALKFAHDSYFYLGYQPQMRDSIARVLPHWNPNMPHYGYLIGMHAFGLNETNLYNEAEKAALKGLEINRHDAWSTHALAHVYEKTGRWADGLKFMSATVNDWEPCGMLACHNFWHWAVYHIEKGDHHGALDIFDNQISKKAAGSGAMLDFVDASSMLYRLEMEGINIGNRWSLVYDVAESHTDDHLMAFNDAHIMMTCLGAKQEQTVNKMIESLKNFITSGCGTNHQVTKEVGAGICDALIAYDQGDYAKAADIITPLRYKIVKIGGSNAQRDVFSQFIIHACMKSAKTEHKKLARHMLVDRKALKDNAPLTDRLIAKAMATHVD